LSPFVVLVFIASAGASTIKFGTSADQIAGVIEKFDAIHTAMKASLVVITISIVLTVVTTGLVGDSIRAALTIKEFDVSPPQFGYVYGLYFSLFLFVLFTPSYFFIRFKQREFLTKLKSTQGAEQAYDVAMQSLMDTDQSLAKQVKVLLVMLSPFISSFLPGLIDHLL
jgi:cytochrome c biogenesis factor